MLLRGDLIFYLYFSSSSTFFVLLTRSTGTRSEQYLLKIPIPKLSSGTEEEMAAPAEHQPC